MFAQQSFLSVTFLIVYLVKTDPRHLPRIQDRGRLMDEKQPHSGWKPSAMIAQWAALSKPWLSIWATPAHRST